MTEPQTRLVYRLIRIMAVLMGALWTFLFWGHLRQLWLMYGLLMGTSVGMVWLFRGPPRPEQPMTELDIHRVYRIINIVLILAAGFWTFLFRKELPESWAPYGLGLGFLIYVAWLLRRSKSSKR